MKKLRMRKREIIEHIICLCIILAGGFYWLWRHIHPLDVFENDYFLYNWLVSPILLFTLVFFVSRWIFRFTVTDVRQKGVRILFYINIALIGLCMSSLLAAILLASSGHGLGYGLVQSYYDFFFRLFASSRGAAFLASAAVFSAFAVTGISKT